MTLGFYFDEHMPRVVAEQLVEQDIKVLLAVDVDMEGKDDDTEHLPFATAQALVMVTFDRPFAGRTMSRTDHGGLICLSQTMRYDIGRIQRTLIQFSQQHSLDEVTGQVFWLR